MSPRAAFVSFCLLLTPQVVQANGTEHALSFVNTCMGEPELEAIEDALVQQSWQATAPSDDLINGLAWIGMNLYFIGDSGGERYDTIYDLKLKSAKGMLRKKDIPQSMNRYMVRGSGGGREVLHVMWRQPVQTVTEVECRAALLPVSLTEIRAQIGAQDLPAFAPMKTVKVDDGTLNITLLNSDALAPLTPPDAIVTTYRQVRTEKVTP